MDSGKPAAETEVRSFTSLLRAARARIRAAFDHAFNIGEHTRLSHVLWRLFDLGLMGYAAAGPLLTIAFEWSVRYRWLGFFYRRQPVAFDRLWHLIIPNILLGLLVVGRGMLVVFNFHDFDEWQAFHRGRVFAARRPSFLFSFDRFLEFPRLVGMMFAFLLLTYPVFFGYNPEVLGFVSAWLDFSEGETVRLVDPERYAGVETRSRYLNTTPLGPEDSPQDWFLYYTNRGAEPDGRPEWSAVDEIYDGRAEVRWHPGALGVPWIERDSLTVLKNIYYGQYGPSTFAPSRSMQELRARRLMLISYDVCLAALHPRHYLRLQEVARRWGAMPLLFHVHADWVDGGCVRSPILTPEQVAESEVSVTEVEALELLPGLSPIEGGGYVILDPAAPPLARIPLRGTIIAERAMIVLDQGSASFGDARRCEQVRRLGWD